MSKAMDSVMKIEETEEQIKKAVENAAMTKEKEINDAKAKAQQIIDEVDKKFAEQRESAIKEKGKELEVYKKKYLQKVESEIKKIKKSKASNALVKRVLDSVVKEIFN